MSHKFPKLEQNLTDRRTKYLKKSLIIGLTVLLATNVLTLGLLLFKNRPELSEQKIEEYPLLDPARHLILQEHFFSTIEPLRRSLKEKTAQYEAAGHRLGIYFEFLNTGANISINQEERFWPASLSKMPTAFAVMKKIETGKWRLDNELVLFPEDQDSRFGELYKEKPGTRFTIETLLKESLVNSDNTAHRILVRNLSSQDYTDIFEALGMEELYDEEYNITAKEYSRVFRALYNASYLNRENSQKLLLWLSATNFRNYLQSGLPAEIIFSHKIGEEYKEVVFLDSGIFYVPNRPCLITVMIEVGNGEGVEKAEEIMKDIAQTAYDYVANN